MPKRLVALTLSILAVVCLGACGPDPSPAALPEHAEPAAVVSAPPAITPTEVPTGEPVLVPSEPPPPTPRPTPQGGGTGVLAFSSHRDGFPQIYTVHADGSGLARITNGSERLGQPTWSPDGTRIAYVLTHPGGQNLDIMIMEADGTGQTPMTYDARVDSDPAWSPDGTRIAFATNRDTPGLIFDGRSFRAPPSNFEIYVINLDRSGLTRLTDDPGWDTAPAWSPDGSRIAFQSSRDGNAEIYVMNSDGSKQRNLTKDPADDGNPAWSPDGTRIAFHSDREGEGNFEIYVMDAGGSNPVRLTDYAEWDINPAWSPDGRYLAFYREHERNFEVYVVAVPDGPDAMPSELARLTNDPAFDGSVSWQPDPAAWSGSPRTALPSPMPTTDQVARYGVPGSFVDEIYSAEVARRFLVHIPPTYQPWDPVPLILSFHGEGDTMQIQEIRSGLSDLADEQGFVVVYPQGVPRGTTPVEDVPWGDEDVAFVHDLLRHLEAHLSIDSARIYASGYSVGGAFAHRLGCGLSDRLAAIGPVAGTYYMYAARACRPEQPVPVVAFHATGDYASPYNGTDLGDSVPQWAEGWASRNGCDPTSTITYQEGDVIGETWSDCDADADVTLYTIQGGTRAWPQHSIDATLVMWEFFRAHPKY